MTFKIRIQSSGREFTAQEKETVLAAAISFASMTRSDNGLAWQNSAWPCSLSVSLMALASYVP